MNKPPLIALAMFSGLALSACNLLEKQTVGNTSVPPPTKPVEIGRNLEVV